MVFLISFPQWLIKPIPECQLEKHWSPFDKWRLFCLPKHTSLRSLSQSIHLEHRVSLLEDWLFTSRDLLAMIPKLSWDSFLSKFKITAYWFLSLRPFYCLRKLDEKNISDIIKCYLATYWMNRNDKLYSVILKTFRYFGYRMFEILHRNY